MRVSPVFALVAAVLCLGGGLGVAPFGPTALAAAGTVGTLLLYALAARRRIHPIQVELARGALVGLNASLNALCAALLLGPRWGVATGVALALLNLAAAWRPLTQRPAFRAVLGYSNWLLPMSWPIVATGALFLVVSALGAALVPLVGHARFLQLTDSHFDRATGSFFVRGGFVSNLNPLHTAFNMGNFSFVDWRSPEMFVAHEVGHSLNLAAFGSLFHLIGAFEENCMARGHLAFAEQLADSNVPGGHRLHIPRMWS